MRKRTIIFSILVILCCYQITFLEKAWASEQTMTTKINQVISKKIGKQMNTVLQYEKWKVGMYYTVTTVKK